MLNTVLKTLNEAMLPPAFFDFWAGKINPVWSWQRALARVVAREQETADSVTLLLKPNQHFRGFQAGQHINVKVEIEGVRLTRSYSPSLVADAPEQLAITVKRMLPGKVSHWLCDHLQVGDIVELSSAFGDMTLASTGSDAASVLPAGQAVFLAAGSGITPFISMIRSQVAQAQSAQTVLYPMTLLYWARRQEELCFVDELNALARDHSEFQVQFLLTQSRGTNPGLLRQRLHAEHLQALVPNLAQATIYACGPAGFVAEAARLAAAAQRPFLGEAFTTPVVTYEAGKLVQVHLTRSRRTLAVPVGQPLLQALEAQGLRPASGCRRGICNTCACAKREGTTANVLTNDMAHEPVAGLRICIHSAHSDLTLDL